MKNNFNRQGNRFRSREKSKAKGDANSSKVHPTSKEIELATQAYLSEGGKIDRVSLNHGNSERKRCSGQTWNLILVWGWELWWMILGTAGKTKITIQTPLVQEYNCCVASCYMRIDKFSDT